MSRFVHALLRGLNHSPLWGWGTTPVWGWRLRAPTFDRWLALRLHQFGLMGVADKRFLSAHIKPGMTVVDIGANQGLYSLLFAGLVGDTGSVLAFEPDDMLFPALEGNVRLNRASNVRTFHTALGSQAGSMTLHRSLLNSGDNRLATGTGDSGPREEVQIRVERLDKIVARERVDFIKLDVQGWEMEVFRGMEGLLDRGSDNGLAIYFEFWPQGLINAGSEPIALLQMLLRNSFAIHQPLGGELGAPAHDLNALIAKIRPGDYTNLYAFRAGS